jgi:hypothetical protein
VHERGDNEVHRGEPWGSVAAVAQELLGQSDVAQRTVPVAELEASRHPEIEAVQALKRRSRHRLVEATTGQLDGLPEAAGAQRPPRAHSVDVSDLVGVGELGHEVEPSPDRTFHRAVAPERLMRGRDPVERRRLEVHAFQPLGHRGSVLAGADRSLELVGIDRAAEGPGSERSGDQETCALLAVARPRRGQADLEVALPFLT